MKSTRKSILAALAAQGAWSWEHTNASGFRDALTENEMTLVAFLGPSTEASRQLETEWNAISPEWSSAKLSVDCTAEKYLCSELDVASFPAIRLYDPHGSMQRYRGPRKAKSIEAFLKRMTRPLITEVDGGNSNSFIASDDVVFVAQLAAASNDETKLGERFHEMAAHHKDQFTFGIPISDDVEKNLLQCYNNIDGASFRTTELDTFASIETFVKKCSDPLIPELTRRNEMEYLSSGKSLVYYFSPSAGDRDKWKASNRPLARAYAQYLTFVTVDSAAYPEMVTGMGIAGGATGVGVSVSNPRMGQVFPMAKPVSEAAAVGALVQFITKISQGLIQPWGGVMQQSQEDSKSKDGELRDEL